MMPDTQPKAPPQPDLTGRTLGDFHILRRIGTGGMGQVYLARQLSLKREVALKLLRGELSENPTALARFNAEAQAVAKLNHPNIVHIHFIGEADGLRYMVLEYVDGRNLRDYLARKGPPDLPVTLSVMRQVALALQKAHEQGIVHRDIKPENILVTRKVEVKVTDFGLSRFFTAEAPATNLTQSGVTLGTPLYMSPEQVQGHAVDHRSDIYSFGVSCYHLLAGEPPFRGATAFDVALKHVQEHPRPLSDLRPDLPADLCGMVHKMMAKNPDDRYPSARDVLRDLQKIREGLNVATAVLTPVRITGRGATTPGAGTESALSLSQSGVTAPPSAPARSGQWLLIALACLLALGGGAALAFGLSRARDTRPGTQAGTGAPAQGLPDVRPPERLTTARERELLAVLNAEGTKPEDAIRASIELGLLYVKENRLAEATDRFKKLEARGDDWRDVAGRHAYLAGRLGRAVVLAVENTPEASKASNELFVKVVSESPPKTGKFEGPKFDRSAASVSWLLLRHPDLSNAVSDALNRNAKNLDKTKLEPPVLEQLRSPQRVGK
jgi:serine/threonine-protein kinase